MRPLRKSKRVFKPFALLVMIGALLAAPLAAAHQQKVAITDVFINDETGYIEVVHSFILHDAEEALMQSEGVRRDLLQDPSVKLAFAERVALEFEMQDGATGEVYDLELVGSEIDHSRLWVYQKTPFKIPMGELLIRHDSLRSVWRDQANTVNIRRKDWLQTLVFTGNDQTQSVTVPNF